MSEIQKLKNEIKELKDENEKRLQMITKLENQLYKSAYYKEGSYAIELVKKNRELEAKDKEIQNLKDENEKLLKKIEELENGIDNPEDYIKKLKKAYAIQLVKMGKETEAKDEEIKKLKDKIHKLKLEKGVYNERGAGRKSKLNDHDKEVIKMYRLQGKTIKEISELYNCSVGLIHKIINEKN